MKVDEEEEEEEEEKESVCWVAKFEFMFAGFLFLED